LELEQNYPNPFNPITEVSFTLPKSSLIRISIYDLFGRELALVLNEWRTTRIYSVTFDASKLSSGVYLYPLQAEGIRISKRMTVIK